MLRYKLRTLALTVALVAYYLLPSAVCLVFAALTEGWIKVSLVGCAIALPVAIFLIGASDCD